LVVVSLEETSIFVVHVDVGIDFIITHEDILVILVEVVHILDLDDLSIQDSKCLSRDGMFVDVVTVVQHVVLCPRKKRATMVKFVTLHLLITFIYNICMRCKTTTFTIAALLYPTYLNTFKDVTALINLCKASKNDGFGHNRRCRW